MHVRVCECACVYERGEMLKMDDARDEEQNGKEEEKPTYVNEIKRCEKEKKMVKIIETIGEFHQHNNQRIEKKRK